MTSPHPLRSPWSGLDSGNGNESGNVGCAGALRTRIDGLGNNSKFESYEKHSKLYMTEAFECARAGCC